MAPLAAYLCLVLLLSCACSQPLASVYWTSSVGTPQAEAFAALSYVDRASSTMSVFSAGGPGTVSTSLFSQSE